MANELSTQVLEVQLPALFEPGRTVQDRYQLLHLIGSGGVCFVLAARHAGFDDLVALKFLRPEFADNAEAVRRFTLEARTCFKLRSEHIVRVFDVGMHEGIPFLAMELLQGMDLRGFMNRQPEYIAIERAVDVTLQVCDALSVAHGIGIIHRDIKPENLFVVGADDTNLIVKVLDFGISKVALVEGLPDLRITQRFTQIAVGTPPYMSPEQVRSASDLDARADIWSVGCVLYELVTGMSPFSRGTVIQSCAAVLEHEPVPPHEVRAAVPLELSTAIMCCLQKSPADRYEDVAQLAAALSPFGTGRYVTYPERCRVNLLSADPTQRRSTPLPYRPTTESRAYVTGGKLRPSRPPTGGFRGTDTAWRAQQQHITGPASELAKSSVTLVPEHKHFDAAPAFVQSQRWWWALACVGLLAIALVIGLWATSREPDPQLSPLPQAAEQKRLEGIRNAGQLTGATDNPRIPRAHEESEQGDLTAGDSAPDERGRPTSGGLTRRQAVTARTDDEPLPSQTGAGRRKRSKLKVDANQEVDRPVRPDDTVDAKPADPLDIGF